MDKNQHIVASVHRAPNYLDLHHYVLTRLDALVSIGPAVETFCKLNSIRKMTVEANDGFRLGIRFENGVKEVKQLERQPLQWLESLVGAKLEFNRIDQYTGGGGYLYYMLRMPEDDDINRIYPSYATQQYWWDGSNWIAWNE